MSNLRIPNLEPCDGAALFTTFAGIVEHEDRRSSELRERHRVELAEVRARQAMQRLGFRDAQEIADYYNLLRKGYAAGEARALIVRSRRS